ncbi:MAG: 4-vinyl reductase, partial [Chloroflexi bacterium]|nr:4-vinyl reductase [Chloroflexota bacterium]
MLIKPKEEPHTALEEREYYYPNKMGRIVLTAMEDIMGRHGVNAVLNLAGLSRFVNNYPPNNLELGFTFSEFGAIQETLDEMYGVRGGRGLAMRAGRETFKYALREFMPVLGIADLAFRPLPLGIKLKIGLEVFAETFNKFTDQIVKLSQDSEKHLWKILRCPVCWGRQSESPCCHLAVG